MKDPHVMLSKIWSCFTCYYYAYADPENSPKGSLIVQKKKLILVVIADNFIVIRLSRRESEKVQFFSFVIVPLHVQSDTSIWRPVKRRPPFSV